MTSETGKDKPASAGTDQRPHATLDLKAQEIFPEGKPQATEAQAALPPKEPEPETPQADLDEATSSAGSEAVKEPPRRSGIGIILASLMAGFVGAVLALGGTYLYGPLRADNQAVAKTLAGLQERLDALDGASRKAASEATGTETRLKTATDQAAALKQEVASLGTRVGALESRPAAASSPSPESLEQTLQPLSDKLNALDGRVSALAKSQDELRASTGTAALTMAVQNLRRAVADGKPYVSELTTLAALAPEPLEVPALVAKRESGLASLAKLKSDFDTYAKAALDAAKPTGNGTFTGDLLAKARGLVRVRPTGDIPGDTSEAILARAGHRLVNGDVSAAIRETGQLAGPAATAMAPWLTEAKAKVAADEALNKLEARLAGTTGSDEPTKSGG